MVNIFGIKQYDRQSDKGAGKHYTRGRLAYIVAFFMNVSPQTA